VVQRQPGQIVHKNLSQKNPTQNRAGEVRQVIECLPSKSEVLSSNSSTVKKDRFIIVGETTYWNKLGRTI
jgi:hypothetical protein